MSENITTEIIEAWEQAFIVSQRSTAFAPSIADDLRARNIRISELEDFIDGARRCKKELRTETQELALVVYKSILKEIEHSKREMLMNSTHGVIFSLKSIEHYEDKQIIKVEEQSLADIIAAKSKQKASDSTSEQPVEQPIEQAGS